MEPTCLSTLAIAAQTALGICLGALSADSSLEHEDPILRRWNASQEVSVAHKHPLKPIDLSPLSPHDKREKRGDLERFSRAETRKSTLLLGLALASEGEGAGLGIALTAKAAP